MPKAELSIGYTIGLANNKEYIGQVSKLNPKHAVILVENTAYIVLYSMLFPVIASEATEHSQVAAYAPC